MEAGTPVQVGKACRVQGRPSASLRAAPRTSSSLLACPTSAISALSPCPASASLTGLAQACPSAPMTPACPCCFANRADAYPVPRYLVPTFCSTLTPCSQLPWPPGSVCPPHLSPLFPLLQYPDPRCLLCSFPLQVFVKISAPQGRPPWLLCSILRLAAFPLAAHSTSPLQDLHVSDHSTTPF